MPSKADAICVAAVDVARAAAVEEAGVAEHVGDLLDQLPDGDRTVTHLFACRSPGYRGWTWAVTVTRVPRGRSVTVSDVVLLPGRESLLAPEWVPWTQRVQPQDLTVGAVWPTDPDDPRLEPGYESLAAAATVLDESREAVAELIGDLGLLRARVLSVAGQDEAAERWYASSAGPESEAAQAAPQPCRTCGFFVPLAGALGGVFGVCSHAMAPDDGTVVSHDHGCGAHSQVAAPVVARAEVGLVYESPDVGLLF